MTELVMYDRKYIGIVEHPRSVQVEEQTHARQELAEHILNSLLAAGMPIEGEKQEISLHIVRDFTTGYLKYAAIHNCGRVHAIVVGEGQSWLEKIAELTKRLP